MKNLRLSFLPSLEEQGVSIGSIFKSVLMAYVLSVILLAVFAIILTYTNFPEGAISTIVLVVSIISILYGGKLSAKKAKSRGWFVGAVTGLLYILILYLISLIFSQRVIFDSHVLSIFLISLVSGAIGGIIGINLRKPEKRYR